AWNSRPETRARVQADAQAFRKLWTRLPSRWNTVVVTATHTTNGDSVAFWIAFRPGLWSLTSAWMEHPKVGVTITRNPSPDVSPGSQPPRGYRSGPGFTRHRLHYPSRLPPGGGLPPRGHGGPRRFSRTGAARSFTVALPVVTGLLLRPAYSAPKPPRSQDADPVSFHRTRLASTLFFEWLRGKRR